MFKHWKKFTITQLNEIEARCKSTTFSIGRMLGDDEKLVDVLTKDEKTLRELNITRDQIADVLEAAYYSSGTMNGGDYKVEKVTFMGTQQCPFSEKYYVKWGSTDVTVTRLCDGETFSFGTLLIPMIRNYGFFEGNVGYRVDPRKVIDFFTLKPTSNNKVIIMKSHCLGLDSYLNNVDHDVLNKFLEYYRLNRYGSMDPESKYCVYITCFDNNACKRILNEYNNDVDAIIKKYPTIEELYMYTETKKIRKRTSLKPEEAEMRIGNLGIDTYNISQYIRTKRISSCKRELKVYIAKAESGSRSVKFDVITFNPWKCGKQAFYKVVECDKIVRMPVVVYDSEEEKGDDGGGEGVGGVYNYCLVDSVCLGTKVTLTSEYLRLKADELKAKVRVSVSDSDSDSDLVEKEVIKILQYLLHDFKRKRNRVYVVFTPFSVCTIYVKEGTCYTREQLAKFENSLHQMGELGIKINLHISKSEKSTIDFKSNWPEEISEFYD